jgi:hypothetical protein
MISVQQRTTIFVLCFCLLQWSCLFCLSYILSSEECFNAGSQESLPQGQGLERWRRKYNQFTWFLHTLMWLWHCWHCWHCRHDCAPEKCWAMSLGRCKAQHLLETHSFESEFSNLSSHSAFVHVVSFCTLCVSYVFHSLYTSLTNDLDRPCPVTVSLGQTVWKSNQVWHSHLFL